MKECPVLRAKTPGSFWGPIGLAWQNKGSCEITAERGTKDGGSDGINRGSGGDCVVASRPGPLLEPQPLWRSWARTAVEKPTERSKGEEIQHAGDGGEGMPTVL